MTEPSTTVLQDFSRLADRFGAVVDRLDEADWGRDSPCEGWSARDVLHPLVNGLSAIRSHPVALQSASLR
jgi:hypothetical protein